MPSQLKVQVRSTMSLFQFYQQLLQSTQKEVKNKLGNGRRMEKLDKETKECAMQEVFVCQKMVDP